MKNLQKQLFQGYNGAKQFIAVPLKHQEDSNLNPQPNFLVIDTIFDYNTVPIQMPSGEFVNKECQTALMKFVYREVLPSENGREEEIREMIMDEVGNIHLPMIYVPLLRNHITLQENKTLVNNWCTMFKFRGILKDFKVEYDDTKSAEYLLMEDEKESD